MEEQLKKTFELYFAPGAGDTPYPGEEAFADEAMALVACYLTIAATGKEYALKPGAEGWNIPGFAMDAAEAADYVSNWLPFEPTLSEEIADFILAAETHMEGRAQKSLEGDAAPCLVLLASRLGLGHFSAFCLLCAWACTRDRGFERVFAALGGDDLPPFPTLGAVYYLYALVHPADPALLLPFASPASPERALLFACPPNGGFALRLPLAPRPAAAQVLAGGPGLEGMAAAHGVWLEDPGGKPLFIEDQLSALSGILQAAAGDAAPRLTILCGEAGAGKKYTLGACGVLRGRRFLHLRLDTLPDDTDADAFAAGWLLGAVLGGYLPCFSLTSDTRRPLLVRMLEIARPWNLAVFVLVERLRSNIVAPGYTTTLIDYPPLDLEQSLAVWRHYAAQCPGGGALNLEALAAKYRLTPGQICLALQSAAEAAQSRGMPLSGHGVGEAVLLGATGKLSEITDRIDACFGWDDLVLDESSVRLLRDACNRIKYRHQVEKQWEFGKKSPYGRGVSILLYGPPGTGKTMSAQVMARELDLPLYRINLSQIVSKYIGETTKNFDAVFNEARSGNVILFFDEADALFAKRTEVKSSNDRHANSDSSYLLQKMEEYPGVCILATNLAHNFDEAFRRRIGYMVNINMPASAERLRIWRGCFPAAAPLAPDVDFERLAEGLELSGSVIKSAALQSAFFAADDGTGITMAHIARAVRMELRKLGKVEPAFLTVY